jgi:DNA-directed RNA polymerase specialized sigma24 family protein
LDLSRLKKGEMDALAEAVDALAPDVWRLLRRGFLVKEELPCYVHAVSTPSEAEPAVIDVMARALVPAKRLELGEVGDLRRSVLGLARERLLSAAKSGGRALTVASEEERAAIPEGIEDLDRIVASGDALSSADPPMDAASERLVLRAAQLAEQTIAGLDEQSRTLVRLRFKEGKSALDTAKELTCGAAAVRSKERRIRRRVLIALRGEVKERLAPAEIDAYLSSTPSSLAPPPITLERVRHEVLKRTFQEEPAPFARRAAWGLGALAIAVLSWIAMYTGVLPGPDSDLHVPPRLVVSCTKMAVQSPRGARYVGVVVIDEESGTPIPILADAAGRSVSLPIGSDHGLVDVPERVAHRGRGRAVALFSKKKLTRAQMLAHATGVKRVPRVATATAAISLPCT